LCAAQCSSIERLLVSWVNSESRVARSMTDWPASSVSVLPVELSPASEPFAVVGTGAPEKFGLHHVPDGLFLAVPGLDLHRPRDRIALGELDLQAFFQVLWIGGGGEPVQVVGPMRLVAFDLMLVEGPVGTAEEPDYAGAAQGFLPPPDVPLVLGGGKLAWAGDAVGWDHAHAHNGVTGLGLVVEILLYSGREQPPGRVGALWAGWRLATGLRLAGVELVGQGLARLVVLELLPQPIDAMLAPIFQLGAFPQAGRVQGLGYLIDEPRRVEGFGGALRHGDAYPFRIACWCQPRHR
jgi:hypothetical protein